MQTENKHFIETLRRLINYMVDPSYHHVIPIPTEGLCEEINRNRLGSIQDYSFQCRLSSQSQFRPFTTPIGIITRPLRNTWHVERYPKWPEVEETENALAPRMTTLHHTKSEARLLHIQYYKHRRSVHSECRALPPGTLQRIPISFS